VTGLAKTKHTCILGTTEIGISNVVINEELNQIANFSIDIANTTENRSTITANINNTVHIYRDEVEIFTGRMDVDKIIYTRARIFIKGYDSIINLHFDFYDRDQSQYDVRRVQFDNIAANIILGYVLTDAGGGYSTSECPTTNISLRGEYATHLEWISAIAHACKWTSGSDKKSCDWWIDSSSGVHIAQQRGSAKGTLSGITLLENEEDYHDILNTAYGKGDGDGINQLTTVKTNATSISAYGTRAINKIDRRFQVQASLDDEMQEFADSHANPIQKITAEISSYEWYDLGLSVGDTVTIENTDLAISSASYRIIKTTINIDITKIDIVNIIPLLSSEIQEIRRDVNINGGYMQGATNMWQTSHGKNVSNAVPLTLKIFIPPEAVYINSVKLSYAVLNFEKYTGVTAGGSAHTHDIDIDAISGGNDIGWLGVQAIGGQNKFVAGQNVSNIKSNATESSHTHNVNANLATASPDCNDIMVSVDGVDKTAALEVIYGTLSTSEDNDLEIKDYLSAPAAGNWHTVIITPNGVGSPAGMCYIMGHLSIQVFIRSE